MDSKPTNNASSTDRTIKSPEGAICVGCLNMVITMDSRTFEMMNENLALRKTRLLGDVKVWAVFCRKDSPRYAVHDGHDYERIFLSRELILQSAAWERAKRLMSPTLANPAATNGVMVVMASSAYPQSFYRQMVQVSMDLSSETVELNTQISSDWWGETRRSRKLGICELPIQSAVP